MKFISRNSCQPIATAVEKVEKNGEKIARIYEPMLTLSKLIFILFLKNKIAFFPGN